MKSSILLLGMLLVLSGVSRASEFDYSQASLSYISGENDNGRSFDGFDVDLTYDANRLVFGLRIQKLQQDTAGGTIDGSLYTAGIGSYWQLNPGLDVYGSIYGGQYDVDAPAAKLADTSVIILTAGLRKKFLPELNGRLYVAEYQYDKDVKDQTRVGAGVEYRPNGSAFGMKAVYETYSGADQVYLGVVYNY